MNLDVDVLIIGAGSVGLSVANQVCQALPDRSIAWIDRQAFQQIDKPVKENVGVDTEVSINEDRKVSMGSGSRPQANRSLHDYSQRVSAISVASERVFDSMGVWGEMSRFSTPYQGMAVWETDGTGAVSFSAADAGHSHLGHIIENTVIHQALLSQSKRHEQIIPFAGREFESIDVSTERVSVALDKGEHINAKLLVIADGARSKARGLLGFAMNEWRYGADSIVATVRTEKPHGGVARQIFTANGPLAFLPLGDSNQNHLCSVVWSLSDGAKAEIRELDDRRFCQAIASAFEYRLGEVEAVSERLSFPLVQRHAKEYCRSRVVLVGDAAHAIHPLAGQGLNLGVMDSSVLVEALAKADCQGIDLGDKRVLRRYERRRKTDNISMMLTIEFLKRLYDTDLVGLRLLRNFGMDCFNQSGPLKRFIMHQAMGITGDLPKIAEAEPLI